MRDGISGRGFQRVSSYQRVWNTCATVTHSKSVCQLADLPFLLMVERRLLMPFGIFENNLAQHSLVLKWRVPTQNASTLAGLPSLLHFTMRFLFSACSQEKKKVPLTMLFLLIFCSTGFNSSTPTTQPSVVLRSYRGPWLAGSSALH